MLGRGTPGQYNTGPGPARGAEPPRQDAAPKPRPPDGEACIAEVIRRCLRGPGARGRTTTQEPPLRLPLVTLLSGRCGSGPVDGARPGGAHRPDPVPRVRSGTTYTCLDVRALCELAGWPVDRQPSPGHGADVWAAWTIMASACHEPCHLPLRDEYLVRLADNLRGWARAPGALGADKSVDRVVVGTQNPDHPARWLSEGRVPSKEVLLGFFPRKAHPQAGRKANVFLDLLLADIASTGRARLRQIGRVLVNLGLGQLTDDQACNCILYAHCMATLTDFVWALEVAIGAVLQPARAKALNVLLKGTGQQVSALGRALCELNVLCGRGVARVDLKADAARRTASCLSLPLVRVPEDALTGAIDAILNEELGGCEVTLPSAEQFWTQRFEWCVGGSHNIRANDHWAPADQLPALAPGCRWNRRAVSEATATNPLTGWDGKVRVSVAEKLEQGKGRAIYSCDTLSYYAFTWLLRPVEKVWRSRRVILDPGRDGAVGMVSRIRGLTARPTRPVFVMLDYSDFNSQHTLGAQRLVIERLLSRVKHSEPELAQALVASFDNMEIMYGPGVLGRVAGSLMSGHRATTFLNSVLNAAYVRVALGHATYDTYSALHVGDDVLLVSGSERAGWAAIRALQKLGCGLQAEKQSVGAASFEFLRCAGNPWSASGGYLARSVAGVVSGNWVTDVVMRPLEALHSMVHHARSLINRSSNQTAYRALVSSTAKMVGLPATVVSEFLSGQVAVAPGPCYRNDGRYMFRWVVPNDAHAAHTVSSPQARLALQKLPRFASRDYVEFGCAPVERAAVRAAGFVPWVAMASSSYGSMEPSHHVGDPSPRHRLLHSDLGVRLKRGSVGASTVTTTAKKHGLLACYPLAALLRHVLSAADLVGLLTMLGQSPPDPRDAHRVAWGSTGEGTTILGVMPYADAAGLASHELEATIIADIVVAM